MSYIGKNPKVDSVKLEGSATAASGTEEGQLYYNTGTGSISKGLKVFKNNQFVSIDKQLGDADTFHLLKAADLSTAEFSAARNSTSTSFLNQNSVPFETTTASGVAGTFSNSSTGDALLTDESADLVFAYKSSGSSDDAQEYFGIPLTVPKAFRGGNVVLSFEYRTGFGTGTTATVDGDFEVAVLDKSTGNGGQTTSTNSTTDITAGSAITVASKTGLAVGQRIRLEAGSQSSIGHPDATVVEAFITSVSSTANEITISEDWDTPHASGAVVVSGWLTDVVPGQLPAADSQTNKQGKKFSIQFKTEDDTSDIVLFFQNKNTSSTISRHLFVDNILLSANKFLQASSKGKPEIARYVTWTGVHDSYTPYYTTEIQNTFTSKYGTWQNGTSTSYTHFLASVKCKVTMSVWQRGNASGDNYVAIIINDLSSTDPSGTALNSKRVAYGKGLDNDGANATAEVILEPGDTIRPASNSGVYSGEEYKAGLNIMVEPVENDVIVLESQDEIFTDWTEFDATLSTATGTAPSGFTTAKGRWRRVGSCMDIAYTFIGSSTTTAGTGVYLGNLPSGYSIDMGQIQGTVAGDLTSQNPGLQGFAFFDDTSNHSWYQPLVYSSTQFYMNGAYHGGNNQPGTGASGPSFGTSDKSLIISLTNVPIAGWNAKFNPLLSMPLVDIGNDWEYYRAGGANANSNSPYFSDVWDNTSGSLFSIINDSTDGFRITALQRCNMNAGFTFSAQCGTDMGRAGWALNDTSTTNILGIANANNVASSQTTWYGVETQQISVNRIMEPGDTLEIRTNGYLCNGYLWKVSVTAERDRGNTNMAHIIKPAVAILQDRRAANTAGDTVTSGGWRDLVINTVKGESWFVTLSGTGTTGVGGTNVDFTLEAGTYEISASFSQYNGGNSKVIMVDSGGTTLAVSTSEDCYANAGYSPVTNLLETVQTFTAATELTFQMRVESTGTNGVVTNFGVDEIYNQAVIRKLK